MQENKPVLELKSTEEKVYQELKWKKNICQCALLGMGCRHRRRVIKKNVLGEER